MTIADFHASSRRHIHYTETSMPIGTIADFYGDWLVAGKRIPDETVVRQWHDLLVRYVNDSTSKTFIARKYSGGKEDGEWNNRRGAVVQFADGFEVVYADNFLAHEFYLMAWHGFVPDYFDFKSTIENRALHITSGTTIEKAIRVYPSSSKQCGCYLAHIVDVNGKYIRDDGSYRELTTAEASRIYPLGTAKDWTDSVDKIYHTTYVLSNEEKNLVKAHFLRFLDPLNHFVTPETKHCKHTLPSWPAKKNIGEYDYLTHFVQEKYRPLFCAEYAEFMKLGRFHSIAPTGYTAKGMINLEICFASATAISGSGSSGTKSKKMTSKKAAPPTRGQTIELIFYPADEEVFKTELLKIKNAHFILTYDTGATKVVRWKVHKFNAASSLRRNIETKNWWREEKKKGLIKVQTYLY